MVWNSVQNLAGYVPALGLLSEQLALGPQLHLSNAPSCPHAQLSCHNTSVVENLCCFNAPGGKMLSTQFWDTSPPTGPEDAWTLHGLWPDHCDGSFDQYCDSHRRYNNITDILNSFGASALLDGMNKYWKDYQGDDANLWTHEWNKHGTCVSTMRPTCYGPDYQTQEEVVDYFKAAYGVYTQLPTYQWLAEAGILPSNEKTYSLDEIQTALRQKHGADVSLGCKGSKFDEVWYHFDVRGSVQTGEFVASLPDGGKTTCPQFGIRYPPKRSPGGGGGHHTYTTHLPTRTHGPVPTPSGTGIPFTGRGILNVNTGNVERGCIISAGVWYVSGTCAKFTAIAVGAEDEEGRKTFTLSSTKGDCAVVKGRLTCASSVRTPSVFSTGKNGQLVYGNNATFFADAVPRGWKKATVYTEPEGHQTQLSIVWQGV